MNKAKGWFVDKDRKLRLEIVPYGFEWFFGTLNGCGITGAIKADSDPEVLEKIVEVLNREMPLGKPRNRKRKQG